MYMYSPVRSGSYANCKSNTRARKALDVADQLCDANPIVVSTIQCNARQGKEWFTMSIRKEQNINDEDKKGERTIFDYHRPIAIATGK